MGRLIGTTTSYAFLSGQSFNNGYTYDAASNRTSYTAPDQSTNTYNYDNLNWLTGQTNSWAGAFTLGYDALGRRTSLARPNGVNTCTPTISSATAPVLHQAGGILWMALPTPTTMPATG